MSDPYRSAPEPQQQAPGATGRTAGAGISQADLIAGAGALITFIFSFLAFFGSGDDSVNAWDTAFKGFSGAIPAVLAIALLLVVGLGFAHVAFPERVITFTWDQIKATWGIAAAGIMVSFIAAGPDGLDKGIGFWFMLIGSLIMAAGTIMKLLGKGTSTVAVGTPSSAPGEDGGSATTPPPPPPPAF